MDVVTAIPPQEDYHHVMVGSGSIGSIQAVPNTPPCPVDSKGYPVDIPPGTLTPEHGHHQQRFTPPSMSTLAPTPGRQPDYQNITPGPDVVNSLANSSLQTSRNYMNITLGPYVALSYAEEREHPKMDSSQDCSLRTHSVRTAVVNENVNYTQLDFEKVSVLQVLIEERKQEKHVKKKQPLDGDVDKVQH